MTDLPYTETDLRTEAARQHSVLTQDPDFMGIGEQMDGAEIDSTFYDAAGQRHENGATWDDLAPQAFGAAQRTIDDLLGKAADVSEWAINLGADGLQPEEHSITVNADEKPLVRVHFAFRPDVSDEMRTALVEGLGEALARHVPYAG